MGPYGLVQEYVVTRADGAPIPDDAWLFVLRYDRDPHARVALRAYAESCRGENPVLADDLLAALDATQPKMTVSSLEGGTR